MKPLDQVRNQQLRHEHEQAFNRRWLPLFLKSALVWLVVVAIPVLALGETAYVVGASVFSFGIAVLAAVTAVRVRRQLGPSP